ncbi:MAG TPA: hypothetical protein VHO68_07210, partial [Bacteroidales bacterium]|nr:hypothetical protein [Bacteroidales bacterium]
FCGNSNNISIPDYTTSKDSKDAAASARRTIGRSWAAELTARGLPANTEKIPYTMGPVPVKPGYTYYVRVGANTVDLSKRFNYSPIIKVEVPATGK